MCGVNKMSKTVLLTDSACDLPFGWDAQYGIRTLNFSISVGDKSYVEREDFSPEGFLNILRTCTEIPHTAHISLLRFFEAYEEIEAEGYRDLIVVTINAGGSNTYDAAVMARQNFIERYPESQLNISVLNSGTYSMAYGWFLVEAAKKLKAGMGAGEAICYLQESFEKVDIALSMFSLDFVKKSGRVNAAAAFMGEMMGLRPIIALTDGKSTVVGKARGDKNVLPALVDRMMAHMLKGSAYLVGYTEPAVKDELAALCEKEVGYPPACAFWLGAAVATNTGPNGIALVYTRKE